MQGGASLQPDTEAVDPDPVRDEILKSPADEASLKRIVFNHAPVEFSTSIPMELSPGESVLLLSPDRDDRIANRAGDIFRLDHGVVTVPMLFMQGHFGPGEAGYDIRTEEGASRAIDSIAGLSRLSGLVMTLCQNESGKLKSMEDVSRLLRGFFRLLKAFLQSPIKKFVLLIHSREDTDTLGRLLTEGILGLSLSAAQEYPSVQFRTVEIERDTDLRVALRGALDRGCTVVETINRDGRVFTSEGHIVLVGHSGILHV